MSPSAAPPPTQASRSTSSAAPSGTPSSRGRRGTSISRWRRPRARCSRWRAGSGCAPAGGSRPSTPGSGRRRCRPRRASGSTSRRRGASRTRVRRRSPSCPGGPESTRTSGAGTSRFTRWRAGSGGMAASAPLHDPFGGRRDLEARRLRLLHDRSLVDDPTRAFRVVRYATRLGFGIGPSFDLQLRAAREAGAFTALSGDRLRRALEEVLDEDGVRNGGRSAARIRTPRRHPARLGRGPAKKDCFERERESGRVPRRGEPKRGGPMGGAALASFAF